MKKAALISVFILVVIVLACIPTYAVTAEYRALWIDGWHNGMWTQAEIDTMIDQAYNHGHYNVIIPQVRKKADALFVSNVGGPSGTGEPMVGQVSPSGFDPLAYMIQEAHARGMEVHPWLCTHRVATQSYDWFVTSHPDWLTKNQAGAYPDPVGYEGYYLDAGVPDGEEYMANYILDLVKNYNIDGIQWDRVRLPTTDSGYNAISLARFKAEPSCNYNPSPTDTKFSDWRRLQMNNFVSRVYAQIMEIKPSVKVGANTFATYSDAYGARFQDWNAWMANKWIDINAPMNYTSDSAGLFVTRLTDALNRRYGRYVYTGFSLGSSGLAGGVTQIGYARAYNAAYGQPWGSQTYSYYWSYTGATAGWLDYVAAATRPYNLATTLPAPMPWKASPTTGIILGQVTDAAHPNTDPVYHDWIYKATVTATGPVTRSATTDGTGAYQFLDLPAGTYNVSFSKTGFSTITGISASVTLGLATRINAQLAAPLAPGSYKTLAEANDPALMDITIGLNGNVVTTANGAFPECSYIETPGRSSGLQVRFDGAAPALNEGDSVNLIGKITTIDDQRVLINATLQGRSFGTALRPLGSSGRELGGALPTTGLLVTALGDITFAGADYFYIDDGSALDDGSGHLGVKVLATGLTFPSTGFAMVTGINTREMIGGQLFQRIRARKQADITVY